MAVRFPLHLERQYAARLLRRQRAARALLDEGLVGMFVRADNEGPRVASTVQVVRRAFEVAFPVEPASLLPMATAVNTWATRTVVREVSRLVRVDVSADRRLGRTSGRAELLAWARENTQLIRRAEGEMFEGIAEAVAATVIEGRTDLARVLTDRFGVASSRAKLIARDQIGSLNARVTEARQTELGIDAYEWSISGDERVRPAHQRLNGTVRRWDQPHPTEGHPGSAIACRCVAIPSLEDPR